MPRTQIAIDSEIASKFRDFAFHKHGSLNGCMKKEAEQAILNHLKREGGDWDPSN